MKLAARIEKALAEAQARQAERGALLDPVNAEALRALIVARLEHCAAAMASDERGPDSLADQTALLLFGPQPDEEAAVRMIRGHLAGGDRATGN